MPLTCGDSTNMPQVGPTPLFNFAHSQEFKALWRSQLINLTQTAASQFVMLALGQTARSPDAHVERKPVGHIVCWPRCRLARRPDRAGEPAWGHWRQYF